MTTLLKNSYPTQDRLFVLDLDRCLITNQAYVVFNETVIESGMIDLKILADARAELEASGKMFDAISWLKSEQNFSEQQCDDLLSSYIVKARALEKDALLAPGARELLTALKALSIPYMIMTYGGDANQRAKIEAAGLEDVPYMVVPHKHKARYTNEAWDNELHYFEFNVNKEMFRARTVVLVDDKAVAFDDLPAAPQAKGYWVKAKQLLPSQQGAIPSNVTPISSLNEIIVYENL